MATNAGGTRETINHNFDGWLVSVGDKTELKMSISKVISNQKLIDKIALNGFKQVSRDFSSETQISKTIDILRLAINNPKYKSLNKSVDSI
jgi:glycosyltransferase involved in cell wall biosynthesis